MAELKTRLEKALEEQKTRKEAMGGVLNLKIAQPLKIFARATRMRGQKND